MVKSVENSVMVGDFNDRFIYRDVFDVVFQNLDVGSFLVGYIDLIFVLRVCKQRDIAWGCFIYVTSGVQNEVFIYGGDMVVFATILRVNGGHEGERIGIPL